MSKWDGKKTGDGRMTITESDPQKGVKFDLSFMQDKYKSKGALNFEPAGDTTKVVWTFDADISRNPMDRYMSLFMEKFVGPDFEEGLAGLKTKAEAK